jgi:hypothetical protein
MSALAQKRTSVHFRVMPVLPPKADIRQRELLMAELSKFKPLSA